MASIEVAREAIRPHNAAEGAGFRTFAAARWELGGVRRPGNAIGVQPLAGGRTLLTPEPQPQCSGGVGNGCGSGSGTGSGFGGIAIEQFIAARRSPD